MPQHPTSSQLGFSTGKKARLPRILYRLGVGKDPTLFLPCDQVREHGPRDFFENPDSGRLGLRYQICSMVESSSNPTTALL